MVVEMRKIKSGGMVEILSKWKVTTFLVSTLVCTVDTVVFLCKADISERSGPSMPMGNLSCQDIIRQTFIFDCNCGEEEEEEPITINLFNYPSSSSTLIIWKSKFTFRKSKMVSSSTSYSLYSFMLFSLLFVSVSVSSSRTIQSNDPTPTPCPSYEFQWIKSNHKSLLEVGILTPNWLDGANYLRQRKFDGFLCNIWEKTDFITYYEDVVTKRPVHWVFYTVGAVLEDEHWQAPTYCFDGTEKEDNGSDGIVESSMEGVLRSKMVGLNNDPETTDTSPEYFGCTGLQLCTTYKNVTIISSAKVLLKIKRV
ncbi:hypothetical protein C5167_023926 [Papaver somniferum]|uniref:Uncharacterized protein n=1 Tax=Papaver somniferum TaxID=3469 RepID=A0A4Y7JR51_PAPSO|nr:hypothetical protein C5167_023926 [Papaver somniferum]